MHIYTHSKVLTNTYTHTHNIFQVVKIAQRGGKKKKLPKILIDAGIHARCGGHLIFKTFF